MTGGVTIAEAPTTGLGRLITDNRFFVPTHQRDYKWDRERVQKYIDDLTEALERGDKFYFVGLMVFMRSEDGRLRVLDGQQRLATTIIIFSALRSWFASADSQAAMSSRIQYDFIGRTEYGQTFPEPKLVLNRNNNDLFQANVINGSPIETIKAELMKTGKNAPNRDMLDAIVYCHARISEIAQKYGNADSAKDYFSKLILFLRDAVIAVRLTVPNESNAFRVFETLNDRGLDLSAVDLIKNYLFGIAYEQSPKDLEQLEHRWAQLTKTLLNLREEDFLKVYWTSRYGLTQLDEVFDAVKARAKTGAEAAALSVDLLEAADFYAALDDADDPVWTNHTPTTRELVGRLKILGSKLVRPAILSGMKKLAVPEFEKLLRVLEVIVVRWQVVGEGRTGTIERVSARLAQQIWDGTVVDRAGIVTALSELYTTDKEFVEKFSLQENLTKQKAIYLLKRIEDHVRGSTMGQSGKGLGPSASLTLEHILPVNPGSEWGPALKLDLALSDMTDRTGNFCLLPSGSNKDLGNNSFETKLITYSASDLLTTKQVASYSHWTSQAVEKRQQWLANQAAAIWKL
jgi:hypothetical protein